MGEIVDGLGTAQRARIADLRRDGHYFWVDAAVGPGSDRELVEALGIPEHALGPLLDFSEDTPPSRKFHADGEHVVFPFTCFTGADHDAVEVHVLVSGAYTLTVHEERITLATAFQPDPPEGRSEQYFVYTILEAMLGTAFDALNAVELVLERLQTVTPDMRSARVRRSTMRWVSSRLGRMRRRLAPQRGIFERISEEIVHVEGLDADHERYFERIGDQLRRLIDAIDAAADAMAKLVALRVNETTYWLTAVATVFLPLTFVTGFFGMNFGWMVRHIASPAAFFLLGVGTCAVAAALTAWLVRRRGTPVEPERR